MPRKKGVPTLPVPRGEKVPYSRSELEAVVRAHKQNHGVCPGTSDGRVIIGTHKTDWARIITTDIPGGFIEGVERGTSYTKFLDALGFVPANREKHLQRANEKKKSAYRFTIEQVKKAISDFYADNKVWPSKVSNSKITVEGKIFEMHELEDMLKNGQIKDSKNIRSAEMLLQVVSKEQAQAHKSIGRNADFAAADDMTIDGVRTLIRDFFKAGGTRDDLRSWHTPLNDKVKVGNLVAAFRADLVAGAELKDRFFDVVDDVLESAGQDAQVVALANE